MKINEVCLQTGLTKKAINYYEEQGLIYTNKLENNYREYTLQDTKLLKEIGLYRKLDISIKDIKQILKGTDKKDMFDKIIMNKEKQVIEVRKQEQYLRLLIKTEFNDEQIDLISKQITDQEKETGEFIKKELKRVFPGGLGLWLCYHFAPYLNEPIETLEKYEAWKNIETFLDNSADINIPKNVQAYYEAMEDEKIKQISEGFKDDMLKLINAKGEELEAYKKKMLEYTDTMNQVYDTLENDSEMKDAVRALEEFKKQLYSFFNNSGYYSIFIPNMKVLSKDYREYQDKLAALNGKLSEDLGIKYDENRRVVKI